MYYKVFLDTNIYDGSNYSFRNGAFSAIRRRANDNEIELQINSVVEGEVRQHIERDVKKAAKELLDAVRHPKLAGFKNLPDYKDKLIVQLPREWSAKIIEEFENLLSDCHCKKISVNGIDVETIVGDYFLQKLPFEPKKPEEFKDAIAVASIVNEVDSLDDGEVYVVVSNDNGFRKAIKEKVKQEYDVIEYETLNDFVTFLAMLDNRATYLKSFLDDGGAHDEIIEAINVALGDCSYDIERQIDCIDECDVVNVDDIEYETTILSIEEDRAAVSISVKCAVKIWYKYTDSNQSFWDREDGCYLWQTIIEIEDTYETDFSIDILLDISGWLPNVEKRSDVLFEEFLEMPSMIVLREEDLIECEDLTEYPPEEGYTDCPDCGRRITEENDGGNGFCCRCAQRH